MARWDKLESRGKVQDRRGMVPVVGGLGLGGVALIVAFNLLTGGDLGDIANDVIDVASQQQAVPADNARDFEGEDSYEVFASTVLGSNNAMWEREFSSYSATYQEPTLVLFRQATQSSCGTATSQVGPHYCPLDATIYLDETFFEELTQRFGAEGGDVAEAYVIAHEVAHHAQNELGIMGQLSGSRDQLGRYDNQTSINLELQADCFAGAWASTVKDQGILEPGEIQEAMDAAAAVGDDRIQASVNGQIDPDHWTHGSSDQRVSWFNRGYEAGSPAVCDTFER